MISKVNLHISAPSLGNPVSSAVYWQMIYNSIFIPKVADDAATPEKHTFNSSFNRVLVQAIQLHSALQFPGFIQILQR